MRKSNQHSITPFRKRWMRFPDLTDHISDLTNQFPIIFIALCAFGSFSTPQKGGQHNPVTL